MQRLFAILLLVIAGSAAFAGTGPAVTKVSVDNKGWVHIITADGRDHVIQPTNRQSGSGFQDIRIASDGSTVGWLRDAMLTPFQGNTNYSYAVALELDIWRDGRVTRRFKTPSFPIKDWIFLKDGKEVAFHVAPTHGREFYECVLLDVSTGEELAHWVLDRRDYIVPDWARPLLANDPLPGPGEISNWFPADPKANGKIAKPEQK